MKIKIAVTLFCLVLLIISSAANASFTLEECFKAALKQSEVMTDQQELVRQAEEHYRQTLAVMLPAVSAGFTYYTYDTSQTPASSSVQNPSNTKITLALPLFRGFRDFAALRQSQNIIASRQQSYYMAALQLYSDTAQAFYLVLSLDKDIAIQQREFDLFNKRIADLQARVAIGRSRPTEVLTVQAAQATLVAQIDQSKAALSTARELLAFLTGLPRSLELVDGQNISNHPDSLETYLGQIDYRPDVQAASDEAEAAAHNLEIAQRAYFPSADLSGNYYPGRSQSSLQNIRWDAQMILTMPLYSGGLLVSQQAEAESLLRQSQSDLRRTRRLAEQGIRTIYQQLQYDLSQTDDFQKAAELAEKNFQAVSRDYSNGLVTNLDVLQALSGSQDALRSLNRAAFALKTDYHSLQALAALVPIPKEKK